MLSRKNWMFEWAYHVNLPFGINIKYLLSFQISSTPIFEKHYFLIDWTLMIATTRNEVPDFCDSYKVKEIETDIKLIGQIPREYILHSCVIPT